MICSRLGGRGFQPQSSSCSQTVYSSEKDHYGSKVKIGPCSLNFINFQNKISKFLEYIKIMTSVPSEVWKFGPGSWASEVVAEGVKTNIDHFWPPKINFSGTKIMICYVFIVVPKDIFLRNCIRWKKSMRKKVSVRHAKKERLFFPDPQHDFQINWLI